MPAAMAGQVLTRAPGAPGRATRRLSGPSRVQPCKPRRPCSSGELGSGAPLDPQDSRPSIQATICNLDLLLGVDAAAEAAAEAAVAAAATAAAPAAQPAADDPPEWAALPPDEQRRRRLLVQRRTMLGLRRRELEVQAAQEEKKVAAAQQRLAAVRMQMNELTVQQLELSEQIDPEAADARRAEAVAAYERRERESRRDVFILLGCMIGVYGLAASSVAHHVADNKRARARECLRNVEPW